MTRQQSITFLRWIVIAGVYSGLLMPLIFIPIVIFPFVFSKLIFFQIVIGLTFPAYVVLAWMDPLYRPRAHALYLAVAAYFVALLLSVVFAVDPFRAWWGNQERMNGLFTLLHFFAWLTMATSVIRTWPQWRRILHFQVVLSGIMAVVPIIQQWNHSLLLFTTTSSRVGGLLDNPIYMAAYQIFNMFFLVLLFMKNPSRNARLCYIMLFLLDLTAFLIAQTRGALIGLAAGVAFFAVYYAVFTKNKKIRWSVLGSAAAFFVACGALFLLRTVPIIQNSILARFMSFGGSEGRLIAWRIAWQGFLERPITGWGLDNFHILFNIKYNPISLRMGSYETWFDRPHNMVLDVLSTTGALGLLTYAAIFITLMVVVWRAYKKSWIDLPFAAVLTSLPVAYFIQNLFVFDHPAAFSMSFFLFALVIALTRSDFTATAGQPVHGKAREFSWLTFGGVFIVFMFLVWRTSILPFKASELSIRASQTLPSASAVAAINEASTIWTPYLDEQTFLLSRSLMSLSSQGALERVSSWRDLYGLAKRLTDEELRRHPRNTHPLFVYARLLHDMSARVPSDATKAEKVYLRAIETSPKRQQLWYGLAALYMQRNRLNDALDVYKRVRDFDLENGIGNWTYGLPLFYNVSERKLEGAQELARSQTAKYPFAITTIRDFLSLTDAYAVLHDTDAEMKAVEKWVSILQAAPTSQIVELAEQMYKLGFTHARNRMIELVAETHPDLQEAMNPNSARSAVPDNKESQAAPSNVAATSADGLRGPRKR